MDTQTGDDTDDRDPIGNEDRHISPDRFVLGGGVMGEVIDPDEGRTDPAEERRKEPYVNVSREGPGDSES